MLPMSPTVHLLTKGYFSGCSMDSTARSMSRSGQYKWCGLGSWTFAISRTDASRNQGNSLKGTNNSRSPTEQLDSRRSQHSPGQTDADGGVGFTERQRDDSRLDYLGGAHFWFSQMYSMTSVSGSNWSCAVALHGFVNAFGSSKVNCTSMWPKSMRRNRSVTRIASVCG